MRKISSFFVICLLLVPFTASADCPGNGGAGNTVVSGEYTDLVSEGPDGEMLKVHLYAGDTLHVYSNTDAIIDCAMRDTTHSPTTPFFFFSVAPHGNAPYDAARGRETLLFACRTDDGSEANVGWAVCRAG